MDDVKVTKHGRESDAGNRFQASLAKAQESGRWMAAAWTVEDGRIELVGRTTWNFPSGDFLAAVGHLALNLFEEQRQAGMLPDDPLPMRITPDLLTGRVGRDEPIGPPVSGACEKEVRETESLEVDADE